MLRIAWTLLVLAVVLVAASPAARAENRVALIIGNQAYGPNVGALRNPHNDIAVVGRALQEVGFELLPPRKDAARDDILFAVYDLAAKVRAGGRDAVSFIYYAGHGVAVGGENVLLPANTESTTDAMLSVRGVRLGEILDILKRDAPEAAHFVVLDACRNTLRGQRGARGFVPVDDRRTGIVMAFSTAPGETATDEGDGSGPYATALAEELVKPGRTDLEVFNAVRVRVHRATGGQTPWTNDGLVSLDRVVFKPVVGASAQAAPVQPPITAFAPSSQLTEAERAWGAVKDTSSIPALEVFLRRYGETFFGDLAKARLAELRNAEAAKQQAVEMARQAAESAKKKTEQDVEIRQAALRKFDGRWKVILCPQYKTGCTQDGCRPEQPSYYRIRDGRILGNSTTISDSGTFEDRGNGIVFKGRIAGDSGSGTFMRAGSEAGMGCSGTFKMQRE